MNLPEWLSTALEELPAPAGGHDWFWLVGILIITIPSIIAAVLAWQARQKSGEASTQAGQANQKAGEAKDKAHETHVELDSKVEEVLGQTRNGHPEPLRKDIDKLLVGQEQILRLVVGHADDIRDLKTDVQELKGDRKPRRKAV